MGNPKKKLNKVRVASALRFVCHALDELMLVEDIGGEGEKLAIAVKALRGIAGHRGADPRSAGIARGALRRIGQ